MNLIGNRCDSSIATEGSLSCSPQPSYSVSIYLSLSVWLSGWLSLSLSLSLSVCLSSWLYAYLSIYLSIYLWIYSPCEPWPFFFRFLSLYTDGRTPWTGDRPVARPLPTHRTTQTQNKRTQTSIPWVRFELTIPMFERAKKVHALDRAVTVIGLIFSFFQVQIKSITNILLRGHTRNKSFSLVPRFAHIPYLLVGRGRPCTGKCHPTHKTQDRIRNCIHFTIRTGWFNKLTGETLLDICLLATM
jgi:hypothetical protein